MDDDNKQPELDISEFLAPVNDWDEPETPEDDKPQLDQDLVRWGFEHLMIGAAWVRDDAYHLPTKAELDDLVPFLTNELNRTLPAEIIAELADATRWTKYADLLKFFFKRIWHEYRVRKGKARRIPMRSQEEEEPHELAND